MRIAHIMLARGFGGAERFFVDMARALADRGHSVLALGDARGVALSHLQAHANVECVAVRCHGNWDVFARRAIARHLQAFAPAIVQCHLARAALLGGQAAHADGLPTIAKTHNLVDAKYYRDIDALVPTTHAQAAHLAAQGISAARIHKIPNFSAMAPIAAVDRVASRPWIIKSAGRLVPKKGYAALLDAFARLLKDGVDARLVLGGDGPEASRLQTQASRLGIAERVTFAGWIDDVAGFLGDAHLFVLPSHDEPFGIVVLEAMARGIPIVTTPTVGPREILDDHSACFAARDDAAALHVAVSQSLGDYARACARAATALAIFRDLYSTEVVLARYLDLYSALIAEHPRRSQT